MYPINLKIAGRKCAVLGGGQVALRKVKGLIRQEAMITVISPAIIRPLEVLTETNGLVWQQHSYEEGLLKGFFCVFCATDDTEVNRRAALEAKQEGALVNVASAPELCDFTLPAAVTRQNIQLTISTNGMTPGLARLIKEDMNDRYHHGFGEIAEFIKEMRQELMDEFSDSRKREEIWRQVLNRQIFELILDKNLDRAKNEIRNGINSLRAKSSDSPG